VTGFNISESHSKDWTPKQKVVKKPRLAVRGYGPKLDGLPETAGSWLYGASVHLSARR